MDFDSDKYINSILLCSNEKKIDEKEKLKLIEYLLYKFTDHKQLLSKLKVLTMKKKINVVINDKLHTENEIEDSIMSNIFAYLDFIEICIPDDIISLLKRNNKEYKNIVNWYFKTVECKKSDRIIKKLIENMTDNEIEIPKYNIREGDINSIDIKELEAFDAQIQKHFKTNKMDNNETMLVNRTSAIIKTLLTKNGTDDYKMYKMLHENNICDKEITRKYFKTLRIKDIKKFMMTYVKFLEEDPSMIVFINNIVKVCEKYNYKFKWKRVFAIFAANDEYDNFDNIDCEKVPCEIFYKSLKNAVKIERYKSFARKVINTDHDTDLLRKYIKKYDKDEFRCIQELMQKRIDALLPQNNK